MNLPTSVVPQADRVSKLVDLATVAAAGHPLTSEALDLSPRDLGYYRHAAGIAGLIDPSGQPTALSVDFGRLSPEERLQRVAVGFARSVIGRTWLQWSGAQTLSGLDPASALEFLQTNTDLSASTCERRARTLRCWVRDLAGHTDPVQSFASPLELAQAIYQALDELSAHQPKTADELRQEVEAKPLGELTNDDYERVRAQVTAHAAEVPAAGSESYIERDYGPFLDAIPNGRVLLADLETLATATSFDELVEATNKVFVDRLGYTRAHLDESERTSRAEFDRIVRVGNFGELDVVCVSLTSANWYAQFYDVIFRFHPYAILLSLEPDARALRFVFREGPSARPRYRLLTGRNTDWEPNDNLLVWAWRLHQLRPHLGEAAQTLQRRAARALSLPPEDVGMDWPSREVAAPGAMPGVGWEQAPRRAFESFVQLGVEVEERRRWGLEAVLRDRFPIGVGGKDGGQLHLTRWELGPEPPSVTSCLERGVDRVREVRLAMELRHGGEPMPFSLRCMLPEPNEEGSFVFEGMAYRFTAVVGADGRLAALPDLGDDDAEEGEEGEELDHTSDSDREDAEADTAADYEGGDDGARKDVFRGLSPRAFYEFAVSRKLAGLAFVLWRARTEESLSDAWLLQKILRFSRRHDHLPLYAWTVLRRFLVPNVGGSFIRALDWRVGGVPPSWACLDRSALLPCGSYVPVAGARLHPTGSLAVPLQSERGVHLELSPRPATDVNPRATGAATVAPPAWWAAPELEPFASLRVGVLSQPCAAGRSHPVPGRVGIGRGSERRAFLADRVSCPRPAPHALQSLIPSSNEVPNLLIEIGSWVEPGTAWLRIQPGAWRIDDWELSPAEKLAAELLERSGDGDVARAIEQDPRLISRVPAGMAGVVTHASLERVTGPVGTTRGWVARLQVQAPASRIGVLLGPNGQSYFVEGSRPRCDMPFDVEGAVDIWVEDPDAVGGSSVLMDPISETRIEAELSTGQWRFAPTEVSRPDPFLRRRTVDGEWVPTTTGPVISERDRLRWVLHEGDEGRSPAPDSTWAGMFREAATAAGLPLGAELTATSDPKPVVDGSFHDPIRTRPDAWLSEPPEGAALPLPIAVIHPWRKEAAAAVLGLTADELGRVIQLHGLGPVVAALLGSLDGDETAIAVRRIQVEPNRSARLRVAAGLRRLRALGGGNLERILLLQAVAIPSPALLPAGFPPGAGRAVQTPLLRAYRAIDLAIHLWSHFADGVEVTTRLAEVELQRCVDVLFGDPDSHECDGRSLAGWLTRVYPLTRAATSSLTHPRLQLVATPDGPRAAIATNGGHSLLRVAERARRPADPLWWAQRAARERLARGHLPCFVGLFATYDERLEPELPAPPPARGRWLAREWLRRIEHPLSRPQQLATILERRVPLTLPTDLERATAVVARVLAAAIPGEDAAGLALRSVLLEILLGFWSGSPSPVAPAGWTWCGPEDARPADTRRAIPPLTSPAWALWPNIELATSASRLATAVADGRPIPALLRFVTGLQPSIEQPLVELPPPVELELEIELAHAETVTPEDPHPDTSLAAPPLSVMPPPPTDNDVHLTSLGLGPWLALTRAAENS